MNEFPFQLSIKNTSLGNKEESLTCTALLRAIPGRRHVYNALWDDKSVIVKIFTHKIRAKHHLKRERRGLELLHKRQLNAPKLLFTGQTQIGQWAMVVEEIVGSSTTLDVFNERSDSTGKLDLLVLVARELARQHSKAVLQKDLHLGNFLLAPVPAQPQVQADDKVFALDAGQMRFFSREVTRNKGISQLASLACCLEAGDTQSIRRLCQQYFYARGWQFEKSDELLLQKQLTMHGKRGIRRGLKKCLRTSKRYLRIRTHSYLAVFDKSFCKGAEMLDFVKQIDKLMDEGRILKNGRTSYVSRLAWNDKEVVVKRYNHKGFIHSLRHTIKKSRASRGWLHAHRLRMLNIDTPKPVAFVEQHKWWVVWKSYLVTEFVPGQNLYDFLRDNSITEEKQSNVTRQVKEMLDKLNKHKISHGDLKHSNILITDTGPVLTDLDAMRAHKWNWTYNVRQQKDLRRLLRQLPQRSVLASF